MSENAKKQQRPEDEQQIQEALAEYSASMTPDERSEFESKLGEPDFHGAMAKTLSEMAMLIAGAAVLDDDVDFGKLRKRVLFEARNDTADSYKMRAHFLLHRKEVEMETVIRGDDELKRFRKRMEEFYSDFKNQTAHR